MRTLPRAILSVMLFAITACGGGGDEEPAVVVPAVGFATASTAANENADTVSLSVTLSQATTVAVTVPYTLGGTATSGTDYSSASASLVIAAGSSTGSIPIVILDDTASESVETVIVTLGTPTNGTLGTSNVHTITIADNDAAPAGMGTVTGRVTNSATGAGVAGVVVTSGSATATTAATGNYTLANVAIAPSVILNFTKADFVPQSRTTELLQAANAQAVINVPMLAVAMTTTYDPAAARTLSVPNSMGQVALPASALRTAAGGMPTGTVTARVTPIAPAGNLGLMPGNYRAASGTTSSPIESYGAMDASFVDASGNSVNLATGMTSTVRIPVSSRATTALPATIPLFYFDAAAGSWREEGTATLQGTAPNQYYEGTVSHFSTWNADALYTSINVTGCVQDAAGARVAGAQVTSEGKNYTGSASAITDANGNFTVPAKANSQAFLQAVKGTQISNSPEITTTTASLPVTACLTLTQAAMSMKLTWGAKPLDLDSHTRGANSDEHVYYDTPGDLAQAPFIGLDVDDIDGFGPEVTTFSKLAKNRQYRFYVHNYSETFDPGQTGSPARVELTLGGAQTIFTPPAGETNQTHWWHVFDVTTDANCAATIVPVQEFKTTEPINPNVGIGATFCN